MPYYIYLLLSINSLEIRLSIAKMFFQIRLLLSEISVLKLSMVEAYIPFSFINCNIDIEKYFFFNLRGELLKNNSPRNVCRVTPGF